MYFVWNLYHIPKNCPRGLTFQNVATLDAAEIMYRGGNHKSVVACKGLCRPGRNRIDGVVTDCVHCWPVVAAAVMVGRSEQDLCQHIASCRQQWGHSNSYRLCTAVPVTHSYCHTDAKHRHIFRAMFPFPFHFDPHSLPSLSAAILYAYKVARHTIDMHLHNLNWLLFAQRGQLSTRNVCLYCCPFLSCRSYFEYSLRTVEKVKCL